MSQVIGQPATGPPLRSPQRRPLPVGSIDTLAVGYWGMIGFIATEAALCIYLEFSYYYYAVQPQPAHGRPAAHPICALPCRRPRALAQWRRVVVGRALSRVAECPPPRSG